MVVPRRRPIENGVAQLSWFCQDGEYVYEDEEMESSKEEDMVIDSSSGLFKLSEITEAIKNSNFNKGLGPDCFDGNVLQLSELLCSKVSLEIMDALNQGDIPDYLRVGRMVPL